MIESWMINVGIAIAGVIAAFATIKSKVSQNDKELKDIKSREKTMWTRIDILREESIKTKAKCLTIEEGDKRYVVAISLAALEKSIEQRLDRLEKQVVQLHTILVEHFREAKRR